MNKDAKKFAHHTGANWLLMILALDDNLPGAFR